jgi:hypothetical protein
MRWKLMAAALVASLALPTVAHAAAPIDGVWESVGYGTLFAVHGDSAKTYETTAISCLPGSPVALGSDATIRRTGPHSARLHWSGSAGDTRLRRINSVPRRCLRPTPDSARGSFDIFWQTFAENYPFFDAKHMNWNAQRRLRSTVDQDNLYSTLCKMILPLHDNHVAVMKDDHPCYSVRPGTVEPGPELESKVVHFIEHRDLHGAMQTWAGGRVGYFELPGRIGYFRISGFQGYSSAELGRALDTAFGSRLRGLIIDVRVNGGGNDSYGLQIASRLANKPYVAYSKRVQVSPGHFTRPQPIVVRPAKHPYTGPVAILTGGSDVSAGETFVQALLNRPRTVRIGQNTQGVFSDILERHLPNGWLFGLPDEEFLTRTGRTFDGTGIPPQIRTPVFTAAEFRHNRDSAFDTAMMLLSR